MASTDARLSVIVASHDAEGSVRDCLRSIVRQLQDGDELIVVDNSVDGTRGILAEFPTARCVFLAHESLINELWSVGIRESRGAVVALTTAHCIPADGWVSALLRAHVDAAAGVGGVIDGEAGSGIVDWAVCFCRYSKFLPPVAADPVSDIPADNAAYKREALYRHEDQWRDGFWEPQLHRALLAQGRQLRMAPGMLVRHRHSFGFGSFLRERYVHGRLYGGWRATTLTRPSRAIHLILAPLIAPLLLTRTVRRVIRKGGRTGQLAAALPVLAAFFCAWACGEAVGYARGPRR